MGAGVSARSAGYRAVSAASAFAVRHAETALNVGVAAALAYSGYTKYIKVRATGKRHVQIGFAVSKVTAIDDVNATFSAIFKVFYIWKEPYHIGQYANQINWENTGTMPGQLWTPRGYIKNAMDLVEIERRLRPYNIKTGGTVRGRIEDGWIIETVRYRGILSQTMSLADFPFDSQSLSIIITTRNHTSKVVFQDSVVDNTVEAQSFPGWRFLPFRTNHSLSEPDSNGKKYAEFTVCVDVQRVPYFYLYSICLQLSLLCSLSFLTVAIPPADFSDRCQTTMSLLLTAIAFKMSVAGWLPRIGYLTVLDKYLFGAVFVVFVVVLENFGAKVAYSLVPESFQRSVLVFDMISLIALFAVWVAAHWMAYTKWVSSREPETEGETPMQRRGSLNPPDGTGWLADRSTVLGGSAGRVAGNAALPARPASAATEAHGGAPPAGYMDPAEIVDAACMFARSMASF